MKQRAIALSLVFLLAVPTMPAFGYVVPVYDPANWVENFLAKIENIAQTIIQYDILLTELEALYLTYKNLENIAEPSWRDTQALFDYIREISNHGKALSYSGHNPLDSFLEAFPLDLVIDNVTILAGDDMNVLQEYWREILRDTAAGALGSTAENAADDSRAMQELILQLQGLANSADGRDQHSHVQNMLLAALLQQQTKQNTNLSTLVNQLAVAEGHRAAIASSSNATLEALVRPPLWSVPIAYHQYPSWDNVP